MPERILRVAEASLAYNTNLDVRAYQALPDSEELNSLNQLTRLNLETSIGERFNVELFQTTYCIEESLIKHPLCKEPFIEIVKRGQKFHQGKGSTDIEREIAEVEGFEKIQAVLTDPDTNQTKVISISPRGRSSSIYQHNFFDVYEKNPNGTITMSRYTSKLSWNEFYQTTQDLDPFNNIPDSPKDADFLANPLITYKSIEKILEIMHPQEQTMTQMAYQKLLEACAPLIIDYLNTLSTNPGELIAQQKYAALCKFADVYTGHDRQIIDFRARLRIIDTVSKPQELPHLISYLSTQPIRQVATACGLSGNSRGESFSFTSLFRPFSVTEFGLLQNSCTDCGGAENHFHCPG
ncbi:MAG: hypothetical protein AAB639_03625, partial [Patescibacteria group bacterium]